MPARRILDYGKFYYEQQQKNEAAEKQRRLQQKLATPKEMQFSARIAGEQQQCQAGVHRHIGRG